MGDNQTIKVDARIIAASKQDLEEEVAAHRFREDLYYRLNVISMRLPALRERAEDIEGLATSILDQIATAAQRPTLRLSFDATQALVNYRWPGNIRELRSALERATTLARTDVIAIEDLPAKIDLAAGVIARTHGTRLREREREYILRVLADSPSLDQAAATLGINVTTLWRKRKRYGIPLCPWVVAIGTSGVSRAPEVGYLQRFLEDLARGAVTRGLV